MKLMEYNIEYDPAADTSYVRIRRDKVSDTIELDDNLIIDLNERGELIGLEILNFSKTKIDLNQIILQGLEAIVKQI